MANLVDIDRVAMDPSAIDPAIFRAYDIRGVVGPQLHAAVYYMLGLVLGTMALRRGETGLALAYDGRISSPELAAALGEGIINTGCDVYDLGLLPTPLLYYFTLTSPISSGVMVTGSHNPPDHNGCKIVVQHKTIGGAAIAELYNALQARDFRSGSGAYIECEVIDDYINKVASTVTVQRTLKLVIDTGHAVPAILAESLYRSLGCEVIVLHQRIDGNFPCHHPDPSKAENLTDLCAAVLAHRADLGLAFDGDGDRLGVVSNTGSILWPDQQLMLFARSVLAAHPGAKIIYDVKCTNNLAKLIKHYGGQAIMCQTGHSFIKEQLLAQQALLAGERSGHIFFRDRWYGCDDGLYAGARLVELLAQQSSTAAALFAGLPESINTPELVVPVAGHDKMLLVAQIMAKAQQELGNMPGLEFITIDGLRINFPYGWGLLRASNTTESLVLRFEADTAEHLVSLQAQFKHWLTAVNPAIPVPF